MVKKAKKSSGGPRARLDLRGKRYEEAMQELDAFIDQALLNNMSQVDIIHGIGTGVIRDAVTKYLRRHRHVKSFEYAPQSAGGSGCTNCNSRVSNIRKTETLCPVFFIRSKSSNKKKAPSIKEDFFFLYHTCPQMLDNLTNWKITINQDT